MEVPSIRSVVPWWVARAVKDKTQLRKMYVVGGLGAGKSHGAEIWDLDRSIENGNKDRKDPKPTISWTVAPNYRICQTLLDITLDVAYRTFGLVSGSDYKIYRSFPRIIDLNPLGINHRMLFLSADNPEHFVSDSITHWRWSEVGVSKPLVTKKLGDRLRDKRSKVLQGLGDGTPEGTENHFFELAGFIGEKRDVTQGNVRVFRVPTKDNEKHLAAGYVEELNAQYAHDENKRKSYVDGIFAPHTHGSAYWEWFESRSVLREPVPSTPTTTVLFCWDFNVAPLACSVMQRLPIFKSGERLTRFVSTWEGTGNARGIPDAVAEFSAAHPVEHYRYTRIEIYGDHNGHAGSHKTDWTDFEYIKKCLQTLGYMNVVVCAEEPPNPPIRGSLEQVARLMMYELYVVSPVCRKIIQSYAKTGLKPGTWLFIKGSDDTWTHWADGPRYCLTQLTEKLDFAGFLRNEPTGVNA